MRSIAVVAIAAAVVLPGCATKKFVNRQVGEVNTKVEALSGEVEETQQRVAKNEARIEEVNTGVGEAKSSAGQAMTKAEEAERAAKGKLIYTLTLSNDQVTFPVNRALVSPEAEKMIDDAIGALVADNRGVFFEIEGHTDSSGPDEYNKRLGEERAMAVRNYLHDKHNVALSRMEVISYGESKPVEDNKTRANRARNRRVVIKVVE
jgi:peptidoglycan-associated lipoprotein